MVSQRVVCPSCGASQTKYGGTHRKAGTDESARCSECGEGLPCPVCQAGAYDEENDNDTCPPGYFRGESTGDCIACHFCNHREVVRKQRRGLRP